MIYVAGESASIPFGVSDSTGAARAADALPTATLYRNGSAQGTSVTVTSAATGAYLAAFTVPAWSAGDELVLLIAATVDGLTYRNWRGLGKIDVLASTVAATPMTLADGAITAAKIATGAIDADALAADAITAAKIATDAIAEIAAGVTPISGVDYRGPVTFVRPAESPGAYPETEVHVGENRWIPAQVVDANGKPLSLDGYTISATLTGSGGFSQTLTESELEKVVDEDGLSVNGLFNWRATSGAGKLTATARSNVRLTFTLTRVSPATTINAHGRIQVVA